MAAIYVALDLETTGLDPETDRIIEVGAVRFDDERVLDTFGALVDPRRPMPLSVQTLTGITDADVRDAPTLGAIAGEIAAFLGDATIVGHNVIGFDVPFLDRSGIRHSEWVYDTQTLAELLLPGLSEYGLAALSAHLQIPLPSHHRAPADAEAARLLFLALRERAVALPPDVLAQAAQWLTPTAWPWRGFFRECWEAVVARSQGARQTRRPSCLAEPLAPKAQLRAVPIEEPLSVLRSARLRPALFPEFDERTEQQAMVAAVTRALNEDQRLIVEGGTGIGKSLAYLIPAACHALANSDRVLVSTATINLQEQLTKKDIPAVQKLFAGGSFRACQLKGRRNYLCLKRFEALRSSPNPSDEEALLACRILIWLCHTETGDRAELRISQAEEPVWRSISADGAECTANNSPFVVEGSCFLQRARRTAEASHVVVVNHSLLLSDAAMGGTVLPPYERLLVDEAHHLEEEATRQFGFWASERDVSELFDRSATLASHVQASPQGITMALGPQAQLTGVVPALREAVTTARGRATEFFQELGVFLGQQREGAVEQDDRLLLNRGMRVQPDWANVELGWENLRLAIQSVVSMLKRLRTALADDVSHQMLNYELITAETDALLQDSQEMTGGLSAAIERDDPQRVVWLERERAEGSLVVAWAPLIVSDLLREKLYGDRRSLILTGATLCSQGDFGYIQERLGLEDAQTLGLGSPFDYKRAALVLVPRDIPEPGRPEYMDALSTAIIDLTRASGGRALALFTSHATLRTAHRLVRETLAREGISVLGQNIDGSARQLVRALQSNPKTVVLGTASFWEGVDIPGEALSLLIMSRLPFNVPSEPVFAARSALYDDPFEEYAVPQAILRFRQGFGRLIRTKTDRGVLVVLDRRIASKRYGASFLESLPGCPVREVALREMPDLVEQWLASAVSGQHSAISHHPVNR